MIAGFVNGERTKFHRRLNSSEEVFGDQNEVITRKLAQEWVCKIIGILKYSFLDLAFGIRQALPCLFWGLFVLGFVWFGVCLVWWFGFLFFL